MVLHISLLKELGIIQGSGAINISLLRSENAMADTKIKLLDTVALAEDLPERKLKRGKVGTVVEVLAPDVFEVEFCNDIGETLAQIALRRAQVELSEGETER
jgi:hypothetical protein